MAKRAVYTENITQPPQGSAVASAKGGQAVGRWNSSTLRPTTRQGEARTCWAHFLVYVNSSGSKNGHASRKIANGRGRKIATIGRNVRKKTPRI